MGREAKIELEFEEAGIPYKVVWKRKREHRSPIYELYRLDKNVLVAHGANAVKTEVENIIGIDRDSAVNSTLIRQGEITSLLDQTPAKRKEIIGKLLGLEKLEKAWELMRRVIEEFDKEKNDLKTEIARIEGELGVKSKQKDGLTQEIQELKDKIGKLEHRLEGLQRQLDKIKQERDELENKKGQYDILIMELTKISEKIKAVEREIRGLREDVEEAKKAKEKVKALEDEIKKIPYLEKYIKQLGKLDELNTEKEQLNADLNRVLEIRDNANRKIALCKEYVQSVEIRMGVEEIPSDLRKIDRLATTISTQIDIILTQIKENHKELEDLRSKALKVLSSPTREVKEKRLEELRKRERIKKQDISTGAGKREHKGQN